MSTLASRRRRPALAVAAAIAVAFCMPVHGRLRQAPAAAAAPGRPKSFPREGGVEFITTMQWDTRVPTELRAQFGPRLRPPQEQPPCRKVKVVPIPPEEAHPAAGQHGLFAAQVSPARCCARACAARME